MISFRVSDEELEKLRSFCNSQGGHNVSELARMAVHKLVDGPDKTDPLESRIEALEQDLRRLETMLASR